MNVNYDSITGLVPAIIQDYDTGKVLMLGYMNEEALTKTRESGLVTFYSRSKKRLWTKGESSGNHLNLVNIKCDCDGDTLLIQAVPKGPTCHTGTDTCWGESNAPSPTLLARLEETIDQRVSSADTNSYTVSLINKGINKVAQKVGEEAVELVIEAKDDDKDLFCNEAADLLYHLLVLLKAKNYTLSDVMQVLSQRRT